MRITVPGNVLLAGEYAITEEGGLGIALAVAPRMEVRVETASGTLRIDGIMGNHVVSWPGDDAPLFDAVVHWMRRLHSTFDERATGLHLTVDSSSFFTADGRKSGLGSSAATVVGLVVAFSTLAAHSFRIPAGESLRQPVPETLLAQAVEIHREIQGGRGSGYDVAASLFGGWGLFKGGADPTWRPLELPWMDHVHLHMVEGKASVSTGPSIEAYRQWKASDPDSHRRLFSRSNEIVKQFADSRNAESAIRAYAQARDHGIDLGNRIGVDATPPSDGTDYADRSARVCKAVGAGNEMAVCIGSGDDSADAPGRKIVPAPGAIIEESL